MWNDSKEINFTIHLNEKFRLDPPGSFVLGVSSPSAADTVDLVDKYRARSVESGLKFRQD